MSNLLNVVERLGGLIRSAQRQGARAGQLQAVHWQALSYLSRCNRYSNTPTALAQYLGTTRGTISQTVRLLERRGLLRIAPDPADGRLVRLALTAKGAALASQAMPAPVLKAAGALDAAQGRRAEEVLGELLQRAQQASGARSFGNCSTCRFAEPQGGGRVRCGVTGEVLPPAETRLACVLHEYKTRAAR